MPPAEAGLCPVCLPFESGQAKVLVPRPPAPELIPQPLGTFAVKSPAHDQLGHHSSSYVAVDIDPRRGHEPPCFSAGAGLLPTVAEINSSGEINSVGGAKAVAIKAPCPIPDVEEEPEPPPDDGTEPSVVKFNPSRERLKAASALALVLLLWAGLLSLFAALSARFEPPSCPADWSLVPGGAPRACEPCAEQLIFLPGFSHWERSWPKPLRAAVYFVALLWLFLGVGIICDQFMAGIEEITSTKKLVWMKVRSGTQHKFEVKVWNPTVANLTLMALGSSAPEILLAIIEIMAADFFAGPLGPSTIVGSAAFNLLVITAVCITAVPAPTARRIAQTHVFFTTAFFSVLAYVWLVVVLSILTPNRVTVAEGVITFLLFPLLVVLSFAADRGLFRRLPCGRRAAAASSEARVLQACSVINRDEAWIREEAARISVLYGKEVPEEVMLALLRQADERTQHMSKAELRRKVMKKVTGGKNRADARHLSFGFEFSQYSVFECDGFVALKVVASRRPNTVVQIRFSTRSGSARAGVRFKASEGVLVFSAGVMEHIIKVPIIDDDVWQPDEHFFCELSLVGQPGAHERPAAGARGAAPEEPPRLDVASAKITVKNDDVPGVLGFDTVEVWGMEGETVQVGVTRVGGSSGFVGCRYRTEDDTAVAGRDYTATEGRLEFKDGEVSKVIRVPVLRSPDHASEGEERFRVVLLEPFGTFFEIGPDGVHSNPICEVVIPAAMTVQCCDRVKRICNVDKLRQARSLWADQFVSAFYVNGSPEDQAAAGAGEWLMHLLSLNFKVPFALVPPAPVGGGWPCFVGALGAIGLVTAVIGDMATLLGCCIGIPDDITAISLVALGTSLPDTFASRMSAKQDDTADNSIGNVTGSNSVNVFLGLGLPWTMAAVYWEQQGVSPEWLKHTSGSQRYEDLFLSTYPSGGFMVPKGSLEISVVVFSACAILCLALLAFRRGRYGGELGGPKAAQVRDSAILVSLWLVYLGVSIVVSLSQ